MAIKAIQQIMLGKVARSERDTLAALEAIKFSGYDGIELNGFMIRPAGLIVRALTAAAGMPAGRGGRYDWAALVREANLMVVSLHEDLGTIKRDPDQVIEHARRLGTGNVVITGMYRFDYTDAATLSRLCQDLNEYGARFQAAGIRLLYHNHSVELCRLAGSEERAYEFILANTDPARVYFEFDSYWFTEAGANAATWMKALGSRMRLWHINDRGTRQRGAGLTPILKSDSMELGCGNMDLDSLSAIAKSVEIEAVVLESHRNHLDGDPIKSMQRSAGYLNRTF